MKRFRPAWLALVSLGLFAGLSHARAQAPETIPSPPIRPAPAEPAPLAQKAFSPTRHFKARLTKGNEIVVNGIVARAELENAEPAPVPNIEIIKSHLE